MPYSRFIEVVIHPHNDNALLNGNQEILCPGTSCGMPLQLHQPDLAFPTRLLGTCSGCGHWSLIILKGETGAADLIELSISAAIDKIEPVVKLA